MKNSKFSSTAGFSLAEMMVVISVIAFLMAMSAPALFSMLRSNELSTQGDILKNRMSLAQQTALSTNTDVSVYFYKFKDLDNAQADEEFRAYQFYSYKPEFQQLLPVSELYRVNDPLRFSTPMSSILDEVSVSSKDEMIEDELQEADLKQDELYMFNKAIRETGASFVSFRFLADGSTSLPKTNDQWYVTLVEDQGSEKESETSPPANFFCIQIDAFNGSLKEFRP